MGWEFPLRVKGLLRVSRCFTRWLSRSLRGTVSPGTLYEVHNNKWEPTRRSNTAVDTGAAVGTGSALLLIGIAIVVRHAGGLPLSPRC
jgi:hypothetical protein